MIGLYLIVLISNVIRLYYLHVFGLKHAKLHTGGRKEGWLDDKRRGVWVVG